MLYNNPTMTTFAIIALTVLGTIALTVLGTIGVEILILVLASIFDKGKSIGLIDAPIYDEEMYRDSILSKKAGDSQVDLLLYNFSEVTFEEIKALKEIIDNELEVKELTDNELEVKYVQGYKYHRALFEKLNSEDTEPIESYLENLSEYKKIIDDSPDKFLDFHFQNSIRDDQYELSRYISNVAKERGITLKAELN